MGTSSPGNGSSWESLCTEAELAFRAACNRAAESPFRPMKIRVIARLSRSPDAQNIFRRLWSQAGEQADHFFPLLASDAGWWTLVNEEIQREHSWGDLLNWEFFSKKLFEWIKAFLEKLFDKGHPAAQAITTILVVLGSMWGAEKANPQIYMSLTRPFRAAVFGSA